MDKYDDIKDVKAIRLDILKIQIGKQKLCNCWEPRYEVDEVNRLVWCTNCSAIIDPFDALLNVARNHHIINQQQVRMVEQAQMLAEYKPHLKVLKELEYKIRRNRYSTVAQCPHCSKAVDISKLNVFLNPLDM